MSTTTKNDMDRKRKPDLTSLVYGKIPPQAIDLEKAVLATVMNEPEKLDIVLRIIKSEDVFYVDAHQRIYKAILALVVKGSHVDALIVKSQLESSGELEMIGGFWGLSDIANYFSKGANVEVHARIVVEKYMLREIIRQCGEAISLAYDDAEDVFELLAKTEGGLSAMQDLARSGNIKSFAQIFDSTVSDMQEAATRPDGMLGVTTGLKRLDEILLGFAAPDLTVLAAGTREGKTTLALNAAKSAAENGYPVGFFSLEMRDKQQMLKVLSGELQEDVRTLRTGKISRDKWDVLNGAVKRSVGALPIYIYDIGGLNIVELKALARTMKKKFDVKILYVDYIQLIRGVPGFKYGKREEEVNHVSKELKALAMELDLPIVALAQLSRIKDKRTYVLSDLRESGAIEQDADNVIFIFRPVLHHMEDMEVGNEIWRFTETDAVIEIAKCRLGQEGSIRATFYGKYNQFVDYDQIDF